MTGHAVSRDNGRVSVSEHTATYCVPKTRLLPPYHGILQLALLLYVVMLQSPQLGFRPLRARRSLACGTFGTLTTIGKQSCLFLKPNYLALQGDL